MLVLRALRQTCSISPSQWEGETINGRPPYIRYRHGELTVRVGPVGGTPTDAVTGVPIFDEQCGEDHDCMIEWHDVATLIGLALVSA